MSGLKERERARQRAEMIFAVRSGQITVKEGSRRLGISRKTYYEWEWRALEAMTAALEEKAPGRPPLPQDQEKERMEEELTDLKEKLFVAEKTVEVRDLLHAYELQNAQATKKSESGKKNENKRGDS